MLTENEPFIYYIVLKMHPLMRGQKSSFVYLFDVCQLPDKYSNWVASDFNLLMVQRCNLFLDPKADIVNYISP